MKAQANQEKFSKAAADSPASTDDDEDEELESDAEEGLEHSRTLCLQEYFR